MIYNFLLEIDFAAFFRKQLLLSKGICGKLIPYLLTKLRYALLTSIGST